MISIDKAILAIKTNDIETFNQFLIEQRQLAVEEALKVLPTVVHSLVVSTARVQELKDEFFKVNKDLLERKEFFGRVLEEVEGQNPGVDYKNLLSIAATEARKRLKTLNLLNTAESKKPSLETVDHLAGMFEVKT